MTVPRVSAQTSRSRGPFFVRGAAMPLKRVTPEEITDTLRYADVLLG